MLATFFIVLVIFSVLNQSPTSQCCHQHTSSPTSVTNIDVTPTGGPPPITHDNTKKKVNFKYLVILTSTQICYGQSWKKVLVWLNLSGSLSDVSIVIWILHDLTFNLERKVQEILGVEWDNQPQPSSIVFDRLCSTFAQYYPWQKNSFDFTGSVIFGF